MLRDQVVNERALNTLLVCSDLPKEQVQTKLPKEIMQACWQFLWGRLFACTVMEIVALAR